jgi:hypothetical protein
VVILVVVVVVVVIQMQLEVQAVQAVVLLEPVIIQRPLLLLIPLEGVVAAVDHTLVLGMEFLVPVVPAS